MCIRDRTDPGIKSGTGVHELTSTTKEKSAGGNERSNILPNPRTRGKRKKNDQQERKLRPAGPCTDVDVADFFPVGGRQVDEEAEGGRLSVVVEGGDQQLVALHCPVRVCTHTVSHHALSTLHRPVRVCTHTVSHHALSNLHRQQVE